MLTEMLLLGLLGGTLGLLLAHWALAGLLAVAPVSLPRLHNVRLDGAVLGFTLVVSVLSVVLAGLLPAWRMACANPQDALRSGSAPSRNLSQLGRSGVKFCRIGSCELVSLGAAV
jgi:putative ABC transport system permease protein